MSRRALPLALAAMMALSACGGDDVMTADEAAKLQGGAAKAKKRKAAEKKKKAAEAKKKKEAAEAKKAALKLRVYTEADFVESDATRDPFRSYEFLFVASPRERQRGQRKVKAKTYSIDQLKLAGIIARGNRRALFVDPSGFGWVLYAGDFVGRSELVSVGTDQQDVEINWRIDRIRDDDVVFIREDASHPEIPPTTRVMPLYPVEKKQNG